jgi:hypothetical protein
MIIGSVEVPEILAENPRNLFELRNPVVTS